MPKPAEGKASFRTEPVRAAMGRGSDALLSYYLEDIRKAPAPAADEGALFRLYRDGNKNARETLIASNMRFVVKVAFEYRACPIPMADLISEGALGLIHAVETFDPDRGVKFISYAVWWIRAALTKSIREKGYLIRLPANQFLKLRRALQAERFGGLEEDDVRVLRQLSQGCASLDAVPAGSSQSWTEMLPDDRAPDPSVEAEIALGAELTERILAGLSDREREVLRDSYGLEADTPLTLKEVGYNLDLSSERIRQIRATALKKIRRDPDIGYLRDRYASLQGGRRS
jgi:RNA polymerase primary sigma factor